jgi:hypothetical protein
VNRRARQTKTPKRGRPTALRPTGPNGTDSWNAVAMATPHMTNLSFKDNTVFKTVQSSSQGIIATSSTSVLAQFQKNWTTSDINQFSSFAAVFDQYRFTMIEIWLTPSGPGLAASYLNTTGGRMYSVTDYDDSNSLATSAAALQYQNVLVTSFTDGHYRRFTPHIAVAAYGGAFTQFKNEVADWIDCASTGVQHYGVKFCLDTTAGTADVKVDAFSRITVEFRNTI